MPATDQVMKNVIEVRALPPEEAWRIAREWEPKADPPIDVEP